MKPIYTTLLALFMATTLMAGSITVTNNNGDWNTTNTWNLNRIPVNGDSIIIPADQTVTIFNENIDLDNVVIIISGTLKLNTGKLRLNAASRIVVQSTGQITGLNSDDQIRLGSDMKFQGAKIQTGASFADNTTGNGFSTPIILPVHFQSFYVARQGSSTQLSWSTTQEENNNYYAIEKSTDGHNWKQVAVVMGAGTSSLVNKYSYTDKNISDAVVYYRIRQVDISGNAFYSAIRFLRNNEISQVTNIYTSSNKTVTIDFNSDVKDNVSIQLINTSGQIIVRKDFSQASYRLIVNAMSASPGVYFVRVSDGKGWSEVKKIAL
jgi:hypothetical protein